MQKDPARKLFERYPLSGNVLEVGSLIVSGTIRDFVPVTVGIDIRPGKGVDLVLDACNLPSHYPIGSFDAVVSFDALEHCQDWKGVVCGSWSVLKDKGMFILVACAPGKGRHDHPSDYWRFTCPDFRRVFSAQKILTCESMGCSSGIVVEKVSEELDLGFDVQVVDFGKKKRKQ